MADNQGYTYYGAERSWCAVNFYPTVLVATVLVAFMLQCCVCLSSVVVVVCTYGMYCG